MIIGKDRHLTIVDAFVDMHVHLREPGYPQKETILTGTRAALAGGYELVCTMPNLNPVPDSIQTLKIQQDIIKKDACVDVLPFASITIGREGKKPVAFDSLVNQVAGFSDDGSGIQDDALMRHAMVAIAKCGGLLSAHCELLHDPHTGQMIEDVSKREVFEVERNIRLAKDTGCRLHLCHISTEDSVNLIRQAKRSQINITAETAPHYLVLNQNDCKDDGRYKINPPIGTKKDQQALIAAIQDGTIDVIATDHAPHTQQEKSQGFEGSLSGIVGLETAFPVLYTKLVKEGLISLERLLEMMSDVPCRILGRKHMAMTYINLEKTYTICSSSFLSKGRSCPFEGMRVFGKIDKVVKNKNK